VRRRKIYAGLKAKPYEVSDYECLPFRWPPEIQGSGNASGSIKFENVAIKHSRLGVGVSKSRMFALGPNKSPSR